MADKKDDKKIEPANPLDDYKKALYFLLALFFIWIMTGGPQRYIEEIRSGKKNVNQDPNAVKIKIPLPFEGFFDSKK